MRNRPQLAKAIAEPPSSASPGGAPRHRRKAGGLGFLPLLGETSDAGEGPACAHVLPLNCAG
jgi:hypothetical protein